MVFFDYEDRLFRKKVRMARTRGWSVLGRDGVYFSQLSVREAPRSGLWTRIATKCVSSCEQMKKLTAFLEPEAAIHHETKPSSRNPLEVSPIRAARVRLDTTEKLGIVSDRQRLVA